VATVGPASNTYERLSALLIREGADVFLASTSHDSHEDHLFIINTVRRLNKDLRTSVARFRFAGLKIRLVK
jgi:pyruvate kinase